ncbi:MAG: hypothetical protein ACE5KO_06195, partial [Candidatus Bathyarchaeia archaeon]
SLRDPDERSWKIALVADFLINPEGTDYRKIKLAVPALEILSKHGYGILQMPSPKMVGKNVGKHVSMIMDQVEEYSKRGYKVVFVAVRGLPNKGIWSNLIRNEIRGRGMKKLQIFELPLESKKLNSLASAQQFENFLEL